MRRSIVEANAKAEAEAAAAAAAAAAEAADSDSDSDADKDNEDKEKPDKEKRETVAIKNPGFDELLKTTREFLVSLMESGTALVINAKGKQANGFPVVQKKGRRIRNMGRF